jgi:hypothetical protein
MGTKLIPISPRGDARTGADLGSQDTATELPGLARARRFYVKRLLQTQGIGRRRDQQMMASIGQIAPGVASPVASTVVDVLPETASCEPTSTRNEWNALEQFYLETDSVEWNATLLQCG